jgi:hypothetical protein
MRRQAGVDFALRSGASELLAGVALLAWAASRGAPAPGWALGGWLLTALAGVGGGLWLIARHGRTGNGFLAALATCIVLRLVLFLVWPLAASADGPQAVTAAVAGLFAGYLPAQTIEVLWFARSTPAGAPAPAVTRRAGSS